MAGSQIVCVVHKIAVTKATLKSAIYKLFYNCIIDNYTNPHPTRYLVYSSFPLDKLTDRTAYPLVVVDGPFFSEDEFTFRDTEYECDVFLLFFETSKKDLDDMVQDIVKIIEDNTKIVFEANGVEFLKVDSDGAEPFNHGSDKGGNAVLGHVETVTFNMKVYLKRITP